MSNPFIATLKNSFVRDTFALSSSTAIAQFIALGTVPVLARVFSPEHFGMFALFTSVLAYLTQLATVNLEHTVVLPEKDEDADAIVAGLFILSVVVSVLSSVLIAFGGEFIAVNLLGQPQIERWLVLISVSVFTMSTFLGLRFLLIRTRRFKRIGVAFVLGTTIGAVVSILCGLYLPEQYKDGGLIIGYVVQSACLMLLVCSSAGRPVNFLRSLNFLAIKRAIWPFRRLLLSVTLSRWITFTYIYMPVFFISFVFGAEILGLYALADRIAAAPRVLIADAIGDVYRQRASSEFNEQGRFDKTFKLTLAVTALVGIPVHVVLYFIAEPLFVFALGEPWRVSGQYASIIFIGGLFAFVGTPLDKGAMIRQKHAYLLGWPGSRIVLKLIGFSALYYGFGASIEWTLWILVLIRVVTHLVDLYCEWVWSKGEDIFR